MGDGWLMSGESVFFFKAFYLFTFLKVSRVQEGPSKGCLIDFLEVSRY